MFVSAAWKFFKAIPVLCVTVTIGGASSNLPYSEQYTKDCSLVSAQAFYLSKFKKGNCHEKLCKSPVCYCTCLTSQRVESQLGTACLCLDIIVIGNPTWVLYMCSHIKSVCSYTLYNEVNMWKKTVTTLCWPYSTAQSRLFRFSVITFKHWLPSLSFQIKQFGLVSSFL